MPSFSVAAVLPLVGMTPKVEEEPFSSLLTDFFYSFETDVLEEAVGEVGPTQPIRFRPTRRRSRWGFSVGLRSTSFFWPMKHSATDNLDTDGNGTVDQIQRSRFDIPVTSLIGICGEIRYMRFFLVADAETNLRDDLTLRIYDARFGYYLYMDPILRAGVSGGIVTATFEADPQPGDFDPTTTWIASGHATIKFTNWIEISGELAFSNLEFDFNGRPAAGSVSFTADSSAGGVGWWIRFGLSAYW